MRRTLLIVAPFQSPIRHRLRFEASSYFARWSPISLAIHSFRYGLHRRGRRHIKCLIECECGLLPHLPRRWPRHDSTQQTQKCRPNANRSAPNPAGDVGRLFGLAATHLSNERHRASHSQAKPATEKRWKWRFCCTIVPFATETRLV